MEQFTKVISKVDSFFLKKGKIYFMLQSDFLGGCYHIYVAENKDSHIFNLFSENEFNETFTISE